MKIEVANRLKKLPPYLFVEIDKAKRKALAEKRDVIDLGIGDPDIPTPKHILKSLHKASLNPKTHKYALDAGLPALKQEIAKWYKKRFNVKLDPDKEILPLIGSKEGIAHIPLGFINKGNYTLVPDPCYPPYKTGTIFAGGIPIIMPLLKENDFLPDLKDIKKSVLKRTNLMFLNYPNNPTSAVCTKSFFKEAIKFAEKNNIIICHDAAYTELCFDGYKPPSFLEVHGAKQIGIEFHSFSKTFNMTGWRLGFACGNSEIIKALAKVKSNIDSGVFTAIQHAGVEAMKSISKTLPGIIAIYQKRRNVLIDSLNSAGWEIKKPKATFYVWAPVMKGYNSASLAKIILEKADVVVTPGNGFGPTGEGYIRMALTVDHSRLKEAAKRIKHILG